MYRLLPLLGDIGLGILVIVGVNLSFERHGALVWLLLPLALIPDLDALPELARRGRVAAHAEQPHDHREYLHRPVVWAVIAAAVVTINPYYGTVVAGLLVVHFLHDSVLTGWGVPWLWPISSVRIKFFADGGNRESLRPLNWVRVWTNEELHRAICEHGNPNWIEHLYLRPTVVSVIEYGVFVLALGVLVWYLM